MTSREGYYRLKRLLIGGPLATDRLVATWLPRRLAMPIFASDALSSVAYATEATLVVLLAASAGGGRWLVPISVVIAELLVIVVASYRQTIAAYPAGGGAYLVASDNIGPIAGLVAAAALLVDYVLTVAVSLAAGVLAISSAASGCTPIAWSWRSWCFRHAGRRASRARDVSRIRCWARAFKSSGHRAAPDEQRELMCLWHNKRRSLLKSRQHLLGEAEFLLAELPLQPREWLPDSRRVGGGDQQRQLGGWRALGGVQPGDLRAVVVEHREGAARSGRPGARGGCGARGRPRVVARPLGELCGLSTRPVAELLVEVGDPGRFTEGGFARFNGTAPLAVSTAEGPGEPVRHRFNPGGNRRVNAILHRMAVTQLRCEPRAQTILANARARGHTKREARRILKHHLSDVIHRRMTRDPERCAARAPLAA